MNSFPSFVSYGYEYDYLLSQPQPQPQPQPALPPAECILKNIFRLYTTTNKSTNKPTNI